MSARRPPRRVVDPLEEDAVGVDDLHGSAAAEAESALAQDDDGLGIPTTADDGPDGTSESDPHVRVIVRVRPLLSGELSSHHVSTSLLVDGDRVRVDAAEGRDQRTRAGDLRGGHISVGVNQTQHSFKFDAILTPQHDQVDVYQAGRVDQMLEKLMDGFHSTIFAYGQTGSGKTHSMDGISYSTKVVPIGPPPPSSMDGAGAGADSLPSRTKLVRVLKEPSVEESGLSLRCINELFGLIAARQAAAADKGPSAHIRYTVKCSFIQIYQESVYDLLADVAPSYVGEKKPTSGMASSSAANVGLRIRWDSRREFYVENLYEFDCPSAKVARSYFLNGMKKRLVASHRMNASSSRSHCIFTLTLTQRKTVGSEEETRSKLALVDLAGSERASQTGASGQVLQQSIGINKSLFVLRKVIKALSVISPSGAGGSAKALAHVPYRDSTLTRLLSSSLGGNCLTLMVACLNPSDAYAEENLSTLNYAALTKRIANHATRNEDPKSALIRKLRAEVKMLRGMLARAQQNIVLGAAERGLMTTTTANQQQQWVQSSRPTGSTSGFSNGRPSGVSGGVGGIDLALLAHSEDLAEKLIDSVSHLKELLSDNQTLRASYESHADQLEALDFANATLNQENDELRERVHFLETVIVEGQAGGGGGSDGVDVFKSPTVDAETGLMTLEGDDAAVVEEGEAEPASSPSGKQGGKAAAMQHQQQQQYELDELRDENQRLREMVIAADFHDRQRADAGHAQGGTKASSKRHGPAQTQPSQPGTVQYQPHSSRAVANNGATAAYSYSSAGANDAAAAAVPSYHQPPPRTSSSQPPPPSAWAAPASSHAHRSGVYSSGGVSSGSVSSAFSSSSSFTAASSGISGGGSNPHVSSVYRANASSLATLSSLQGRAGKLAAQRKSSAKRASAASSTATRSAAPSDSSTHPHPHPLVAAPLSQHAARDWEHARSAELLEERAGRPSDDPLARHPHAWDARTSGGMTPQPAVGGHYPLARGSQLDGRPGSGLRGGGGGISGSGSGVPNLAQAAMNNPTIARYVQQQITQQQQQQQQATHTPPAEVLNPTRDRQSEHVN